MTVHLITVGDSARRSLTDPRHDPPPQGLVRYSGGDQVLCDAELLSVDPDDAGSVADFLARLAGGAPTAQGAAADLYRLAGIGAWRTTASAEITSLDARTKNTSIGTEDMVVLLSTDTSRGLLAAWWNAAHMLRGDFSRLTYLDNPESDLPAPPRNGRAVIVRLPGLDLRHPAQHTQAMQGMGHVARHILDSLTDGEKVDIHLSGGYKATMLYLIGIAEAMRSVPPPIGDFANVAAFVVHEDSTPDDPNRLIHLPLRALDPTHLRDELATAATGTVPGGDLLRGYAYTVDLTPGKLPRARLTPFGEGFRILLGSTPGVPG